MLAHALRSTRDRSNPYVTILLTFLQMVLQRPGLATLKHAIPWADLAAFLTRRRKYHPIAKPEVLPKSAGSS